MLRRCGWLSMTFALEKVYACSCLKYMHTGLTNPMCKFLNCHPECSEGSQVLIDGSDGDVTGGWFEA